MRVSRICITKLPSRINVTVTHDLYITGDGSDGRILWVEVLDSTGTRNFENVESALFECDDSNDSGAGNSQMGDGKTVLGDSRISSGDSKLMKIKVGA